MLLPCVRFLFLFIFFSFFFSLFWLLSSRCSSPLLSLSLPVSSLSRPSSQLVAVTVRIRRCCSAEVAPLWPPLRLPPCCRTVATFRLRTRRPRPRRPCTTTRRLTFEQNRTRSDKQTTMERAGARRVHSQCCSISAAGGRSLFASGLTALSARSPPNLFVFVCVRHPHSLRASAASPLCCTWTTSSRACSPSCRRWS